MFGLCPWCHWGMFLSPPQREITRVPNSSPWGLQVGLLCPPCVLLCDTCRRRGSPAFRASLSWATCCPKAWEAWLFWLCTRSHQNATFKTRPVYPHPKTYKTWSNGFLFLFLVTEKQCALVSGCQVLVKHCLWAGIMVLKQEMGIPAQIA